MARRNPPRKVRYFAPVAPRLARNIIIESTFEVGRCYRCTMRVDHYRPRRATTPQLAIYRQQAPEFAKDR
jgi:hypothetical protein